MTEEQGEGASVSPTGLAGAEAPEPPSRLGPSDGIPSAGHNEPDWFGLAKAMAVAVMFQRGTRGVHVVGKDGRARAGCVDLLGCYAVDDMARRFCELAGIDFEILDPPTEQEAMFMMGAGMRFQDWLERPLAIRQQARGGREKAEVDLLGLASAIEAATAGETTQIGSTEGESAVPPTAGDAQPTGDNQGGE